ncbi:hypothetical protein P3T43_005371 [Paraburkholderia sp. GAS41]
MSLICALRNAAHTAPGALTRRPASFYVMRLSSLQHVIYAIADAMLAGPGEPDSIVERMTRCLGVRSERMPGLARIVVRRFGTRWERVDRKEVSMMIAGAPGFVAAWRSDMRPTIVQVLRKAPIQRLPPPRLLAPDVHGKMEWLEKQRYRTRHLPQGAPTSPALANLCAFRLDLRLAGLARALGATYTRYADGSNTRMPA